MPPADEPWAITVNVGGPVDPRDHIGHLAEFDETVQSLQSVGALLTGDRRMGKTSLLGKVEDLVGTEHVVLRISAETEDPDLFASRLLACLQGHRHFADELDRWDLSVDVAYKGIRLQRRPKGESGPMESDELFAWAAGRAKPGKLIVIIDEISVLAEAMERQAPGGSVEFLRSLRRARQELDNVVIILAGSVGLHHAVKDPTPINDLRKVRVGPLEHDDAVFLARCLFLGERIETIDELAAAEAIAEATDGIPYFIHHLVAAARRRGGLLTPDVVVELREAALVDPDDPWNVRHYRERLSGYYGTDAPLVTHLLDAYAESDQPTEIDAILSLLAAIDLEPRPTRDRVLACIESLEADHYLVRIGNASQFSSRILRDAWRRMRRR